MNIPVETSGSMGIPILTAGVSVVISPLDTGSTVVAGCLSGEGTSSGEVSLCSLAVHGAVWCSLASREDSRSGKAGISSRTVAYQIKKVGDIKCSSEVEI